MRLVAGWAVDTLPDLRRLEILIQPGNAPSRRVAERAGATFERVRHNGLVLRDRGVVDAAVYALQPDDVAR